MLVHHSNLLWINNIFKFQFQQTKVLIEFFVMACALHFSTSWILVLQIILIHHSNLHQILDKLHNNSNECLRYCLCGMTCESFIYASQKLGLQIMYLHHLNLIKTTKLQNYKTSNSDSMKPKSWLNSMWWLVNYVLALFDP